MLRKRIEIERAIKAAWRPEWPVLPQKVVLLTAPLSQAKMIKGKKVGVLSWILNLAPARESGILNTCPWAGECAKSCIKGTGQNSMSPAESARLWRTYLFHYLRPLFEELLEWEIRAAVKSAERKDMLASFRLNGLSDVSWRKQSWLIHELGARAYDYTKGIRRALSLQKTTPHYHLVYSWNENSPHELGLVKEFLRNGGSVAVVFATDKPEEFPESFLGHPVINGDENDARFMDAPGSIVALTFKAAANRQQKCDEAVKAGFAVKIGG